MRRLKALYTSAFPKYERKPFWMIERKKKEGVMETLVIEEEGEFAGLAISILFEDVILLDYFAIEPKFRSKGLGGRALQAVRDRYEDRRFLLEIERTDVKCDNVEQRIRRKKFYLRNGLTETGVKVLLFDVPMEILSDGSPYSFGEYQRLYQMIAPGRENKVVEMQ